MRRRSAMPGFAPPPPLAAVLRLAACPFCGSDAVRVVKRLSERHACRLYQAECDECGASGGPCFDETAAAEVWNRRPAMRLVHGREAA